MICLFCPSLNAQPAAAGGGYTCTVTVEDAQSHEPMGYALVSMKKPGGADRGGTTNAAGICTIGGLAAGEYTLRVTFIGYAPMEVRLSVTGNVSLAVPLRADVMQMDEVVVTASESKGMTSSSVIDRRAMEHLQPSSFSDLMELLPGGRSADPRMGEANLIRLREANKSATDGSQYSNTSLGTSYMIDGAPIATGANMQYASGGGLDQRNITGKGVDMRTLPTDDIQRVEVVRGIPSVEYGDLTNGLVKIERRKGGNDLRARFKADALSKLAYVGKGFEWAPRKLTLNAGIDFLDSKVDPRNNLENFKRLTASLRLSKGWDVGEGLLVWDSNLDYGGSFDDEKVDPDLNYHHEDRYKSSYNRFAWTNNLRWEASRSGFFRDLALYTSVSLQKDKIEQMRYVQLTRDMAVPDTREPGEHDGAYLPYQYVASMEVDGRPLGAFAKLMANFQAEALGIFHRIKAGADWKMDKNLGRGQLYDPLHPVYPGMSTRPRPYNDIPAGHDLSLFVEEHAVVPVGTHKLEVMAGLRTTTMLNLDEQYALRGKFFFDPRVNLRWVFPGLNVAGRPLVIELGGGVGWHTKTPTLTQLYPNLFYYDLIQLNYYHTNPDYRRLNLMTYVIDRTNYGLSAARNFKWEVRTDLSYEGHRLSVDYFREDMTSWFRDGSVCRTFEYKKYDAGGIDHDALQGPPSLENMPFVRDTLIENYGITTNGSRLYKQGVEFQYTSKRIPSLRTRITVNGAWLRTVYRNSQLLYEKPSKVIDGKQFPYMGIYDDPDGYTFDIFNTNFTLDTDIPRLKLGFSASVQCLWFSTMHTLRRSGVPVAYIDIHGVTHPYTEASREDKYLQWLLKNYNDEQFKERIEDPFNINVNLKVTKRLYGERIALAFFVNKLLSYNPDYRSGGVTVRQVGKSPYFGMELNFKL